MSTLSIQQRNILNTYGYVQRNGYCLYSEKKIQGLTSKRNSHCASCCL